MQKVPHHAALTVLMLNLALFPGQWANSQTTAGEWLLDTIQYRTFQYFWDGAEPYSGLARERYHVDGVYPQNDKHIITSGGSGFGLMALVVGMERDFITRSQGLDRLERNLDFLEKADRFHGVWPHWLNGETGKVRPFSTKDNGGDLVETAYLVQGLLTVRQYLDPSVDRDKELQDRITALVNGVEWDWYRKEGENVLYWHWSPSYAWEMNHQIRGYNECLITYILAASSPTHSIPPEVYHEGWARRGEIKGEHRQYGLLLDMNHNGDPEYGGPLFWAHYSYLGLDPRGLKDRYSDYWIHNKNHSLINYNWCVENPHGYKGYGKDCWGLTASYSPGGYSAHSPARDLGVISPTAALSSFPYTPEESGRAAAFFYDSLGSRLMGPFGFYDAFSLEEDWFPERYLAIDQGPIVIMIENFRSGLLWELFMSNQEIQDGLNRLGFTFRKPSLNKNY
jgi:hypothetical protein